MATLVRWDPFRELAQMQSDMSRLFGSFLGTEGTGPGNGQGRTWVPAVDVWETDADVVYAFDLPGIPEDKISVEFEDGAVTVSAERSREHEVKDDKFYRFERRFGTFTRTIGLPQGISENDIAADYKNGVLELHVKKPEQPKPRRIQVGGSQQKTIEGTATQTS